MLMAIYHHSIPTNAERDKLNELIRGHISSLHLHELNIIGYIYHHIYPTCKEIGEYMDKPDESLCTKLSSASTIVSERST